MLHSFRRDFYFLFVDLWLMQLWTQNDIAELHCEGWLKYTDLTLAYIFNHAVCCTSVTSLCWSLHLILSQLRTKHSSSNCLNYVRWSKSSIKKRIIVCWTDWSMFGEQTLRPVKNELYKEIVTKTDPKHSAMPPVRFSLPHGVIQKLSPKQISSVKHSAMPPLQFSLPHGVIKKLSPKQISSVKHSAMPPLQFSLPHGVIKKLSPKQISSVKHSAMPPLQFSLPHGVIKKLSPKQISSVKHSAMPPLQFSLPHGVIKKLSPKQISSVKHSAMPPLQFSLPHGVIKKLSPKQISSVKHSAMPPLQFSLPHGVIKKLSPKRIREADSSAVFWTTCLLCTMCLFSVRFYMFCSGSVVLQFILSHHSMETQEIKLF